MNTTLSDGICKPFDLKILETRWDPTARQRFDNLLARLYSNTLDPAVWSFGEWRYWDKKIGSEARGIYIPNAPWRKTDIKAVSGYDRPENSKAHDPVLMVFEIDKAIVEGKAVKVSLVEQLRRYMDSGLPVPSVSSLSGDGRDGDTFIEGKSIHNLLALKADTSFVDFKKLADLGARKLGTDPAAARKANLFRMPGAEWVAQDRKTKRRQTVLFMNEAQQEPYDAKLLIAILEKLPDLATAPTKKTTPKNRQTPKLDPETTIPGFNLTARALADQIGEGNSQPIPCPFHNDASPSAVLFANPNDSLTVFCSTCDQSWTSGSPGLSVKSWLTSKVGPKVKQEAKEEALPFRFVDVRTEKFLGPVHFTSGSEIFLKAPMAVGKTEGILAGIQNYLSRTKLDIIYLVHRRDLISSSAARLRKAGIAVRDYREIKGQILPSGEGQVLVICLDSLHRVKYWQGKSDPLVEVGNVRSLGQKVPWGALIIDECEQVLKHLVGDTIKAKYERVFEALRMVTKCADALIYMDAHLGDLTVQVMRRIQDRDPTYPAGQLIVSEAYPNRQGLIYADPAQLDLDLRKDLLTLAHGQLAVYCSSRKNSYRVARAFQKAKRPYLLLNSETRRASDQVQVQEFAQNPRQWLQDHPTHDLIYSPSMGTGVNLDAVDRFTRVYAYCDPQSGPGTLDHLQALDRVRTPTDAVRRIWIGAEKLHLATKSKGIKRKALEASELNARILGAKAMPEVRHHVREEHIFAVPGNELAFDLWAEIIAVRNQGRNNQREDMLTIMEVTRWTLSFKAPPDENSSELRCARALAKTVTKGLGEAELNAILKADPTMTSERADEILHHEAPATAAELAQARHADIRDLAPGMPVTKERVKSYKKGKLWGQIALYALARACRTKDKDTLKLAQKINLTKAGQVNDSHNLSKASLLAIITDEGQVESKIHDAAAKLKTLGTSVGNDSSSVSEIVGYAWAKMGIKKKRVRRSCSGVLGFIAKNEDPKPRNKPELIWTVSPDDLAWFEKAADEYVRGINSRFAPVAFMPSLDLAEVERLLAPEGREVEPEAQGQAG